jgi:hypothetical protein
LVSAESPECRSEFGIEGFGTLGVLNRERRSSAPSPMTTMGRAANAIEVADRVVETADAVPVFPRIGKGICTDIVAGLYAIPSHEHATQAFTGIGSERCELSAVRIRGRIAHGTIVCRDHNQVRHEPAAFVSPHIKKSIRHRTRRRRSASAVAIESVPGDVSIGCPA